MTNVLNEPTNLKVDVNNNICAFNWSRLNEADGWCGYNKQFYILLGIWWLFLAGFSKRVVSVGMRITRTSLVLFWDCMSLFEGLEFVCTLAICMVCLSGITSESMAEIGMMNLSERATLQYSFSRNQSWEIEQLNGTSTSERNGGK